MEKALVSLMIVTNRLMRRVMLGVTSGEAKITKKIEEAGEIGCPQTAG